MNFKANTNLFSLDLCENGAKIDMFIFDKHSQTSFVKLRHFIMTLEACKLDCHKFNVMGRRSLTSDVFRHYSVGCY